MARAKRHCIKKGKTTKGKHKGRTVCRKFAKGAK